MDPILVSILLSYAVVDVEREVVPCPTVNSLEVIHVILKRSSSMKIKIKT